jgi:hypothetical protein
VDIAQYSIENSMDMAQYYPLQWKQQNSPKFKAYGLILSTKYCMDFAQNSPQATDLILLNNIHRIFNV